MQTEIATVGLLPDVLPGALHSVAHAPGDAACLAGSLESGEKLIWNG
jgi:hypothetical protein